MELYSSSLRSPDKLVPEMFPVLGLDGVEDALHFIGKVSAATAISVHFYACLSQPHYFSGFRTRVDI